MRRWLLAAVMASAWFGCAGFSHRPPPGPQLASASEPERAPAAIPPVALPDGPLTPDRAALLAVASNPRLRAIRAERGLAHAELVEARVLPNPRARGSLEAPVGGEEAKVMAYDVELAWNVTPLFARSARVSAAEQAALGVDLEVAWHEWLTAQTARLQAIRAIYLERRVSVAAELEASWQQRAAAMREVRAAGAVSVLETTNAERSEAEARVDRLELERELVIARAALARALGTDPTRPLAVDPSFALRIDLPNESALLDGIPRHRLDLIGLQHAHRSHDEALRAATIAQFPPVEIGLRTRREVDGNASAGVGVSFDIPVLDSNQHTIAAETARRAQVEAEYDARLMEARADSVQALHELALLAQQLEAARAAVAASAPLAEQARSAAVAGALDPLLAADIFRRSFESRLRALEIEQTLAEMQVALALASGVDGDGSGE